MRAIAGALLALTLMFGSVLAAQETASDPSTKDDPSSEDDFLMVAILSRDCGDKVPTAGPGSAAEPIEVDLNELQFVEDYDCKWISSRATLRGTNYWHYKADAYGDLMDLYFYPYDSYRLLIEDFSDPAATMRDLQHADVDFVALFADLCGQTAVSENTFVYGGPCHYGPAGLLKKARVTTVISPPLRRLTGEANRDILQRLWRAPKGWKHEPSARASMIAWIAAVQKGPESYRERLFGAMDTWDDEDRKYALDPDAWHNFISGETSPLRPLRSPSRRWDIQYFVDGDRPDDWSDIDYVNSCVCLIDDCGDRWPLAPQDVDRMWGDYLCAETERNQDGEWLAEK